MSHGHVITRSTYLFCKGKQTNRSKTFFSGTGPQDNMSIWENLKK